MFDIQLFKDNINIALESYAKIKKRYINYYEYQENILGDKITVSFKDLYQTNLEKITDEFENIIFNETEINIYYLNHNNLNNEIHIEYSINGRLINGKFYDKIYNVFLSVNKIDEIETMYLNIDAVKQAVLDFKISKEAIIDFIDVNSNDLELSPAYIKKVKSYFKKYDFIDRLNAAEISKNMKWSYITTYMVRQNILYKIIDLYINKEISRNTQFT